MSAPGSRRSVSLRRPIVNSGLSIVTMRRPSASVTTSRGARGASAISGRDYIRASRVRGAARPADADGSLSSGEDPMTNDDVVRRLDALDTQNRRLKQLLVVVLALVAVVGVRAQIAPAAVSGDRFVLVDA